jgi:hypothetical protein
MTIAMVWVRSSALAVASEPPRRDVLFISGPGSA